MKIILRDRNEDIVNAWRTTFAGCDDIEIGCGHIFEVKAEAIVSPANSFGFMDGGIDAVYSVKFGWELSERLRKHLQENHSGDLFVGQSVSIETGHPDYPWLIAAPTMYVPMVVSGTINAYLAFRAALQAAAKIPVNSVLCPGLGTAIGRMDPVTCAVQMRVAYEVFKGETLEFDDLADAWGFHENLRRGQLPLEFLVRKD